MIFKQNAHRPPSFEWGKNYRTLIANINSLSRAIKHALAQQLGKKTIYTDLFNDPNSTNWKGLLTQQGVDIKVVALLMSGIDLH